VLRAHGVELEAARTELRRLAGRGVVPAPRPSDAQLLGALGIDLDAVRHNTEQTFGSRAVGEATWRVTRRRGWVGREGGVDAAVRATVYRQARPAAGWRAGALGHGEVGPEHVLLGVLEDARQPAGSTRGSRRHRRITAHVGLPKGYRGAAGPLLAAFGVTLAGLRDAVAVELGGVQR